MKENVGSRLEFTHLVGTLPRWRFERHLRHAKSTSFGTGFVHAAPKTLTTEMMEEVFFRIIDFPLGYVP